MLDVRGLCSHAFDYGREGEITRCAWHGSEHEIATGPCPGRCARVGAHNQVAMLDEVGVTV